MATSTLINFLGDGVTTPTGIGADVINRRQTETFIAGGAITAGDWVSFDTSQAAADKALYVVQSPAAAADARVCGVALTTVASGEQVSVVIDGYVASANVANGALVGNALQTSGVAGRAIAATYDPTLGAAQPLPVICGRCLTNAAGNVAEVMVVKTF